jgi:hypothetical protein
MLMALGCLAVSRVLLTRRPPGMPTLVISNVNRHAGLALLLASGHFPNGRGGLPAIAAYALVAPLVMMLYARWIYRTSPTSPPP